ncbi:MAG: hypothetical protein ACTIAY_10710, partial [Microbacterium gubbeenense]
MSSTASVCTSESISTTEATTRFDKGIHHARRFPLLQAFPTWGTIPYASEHDERMVALRRDL